MGHERARARRVGKAAAPLWVAAEEDTKGWAGALPDCSTAALLGCAALALSEQQVHD